MDDAGIIELFFARDGEAVAELLTRGCTEHCDISRFSPMRLYAEN